jgi:transposase
MVAYAGLNPNQHGSGTSIDRPTRISKVGNATLRSSLYMPALSAMRYNPPSPHSIEHFTAQIEAVDTAIRATSRA